MARRDRQQEQYRRGQQNRDDRDRYYEDNVGLRNLEPGRGASDYNNRSFNQNQREGFNYGSDYDRNRFDENNDYIQDYGRTRYYDESIAGRPTGFEGSYGYRAGSPSTFGTGGRFMNFGVGRNTSIGQSGYGSSEVGRGVGRGNWSRGESWRSEFDGDYFGSNYSGRGPKGYRRSDDRIREDVCEALTFDPYVDASELEILVSEGTVTLSGTVNDRDQKRRAEETIENVSGVRDVHNNVRVDSSRFDQEHRAEKGSTQTGKETKRAA